MCPSSYVILKSFYIYWHFSSSFHTNLVWKVHVAEPRWSNVIFLIFPCSYLPSFTSTIKSFQFITAVSECCFMSSWATLVLCCCPEWEPCSCSVLSPSHGFTIYPFLALAVLLFDTPMSLFHPRKWQKTPGFPAWSSFTPFWCSHTLLAPSEQAVLGEEVARAAREPLPGGPLYLLTQLTLLWAWSHLGLCDVRAV